MGVGCCMVERRRRGWTEDVKSCMCWYHVPLTVCLYDTAATGRDWINHFPFRSPIGEVEDSQAVT